MFDLNQTTSSKARIFTKVVSADRLTPVKILEQMTVAALLETAYTETGKGKYSIILLKEAFTIYKKNNSYSCNYYRHPLRVDSYAVGNGF